MLLVKLLLIASLWVACINAIPIIKLHIDEASASAAQLRPALFPRTKKPPPDFNKPLPPLPPRKNSQENSLTGPRPKLPTNVPQKIKENSGTGSSTALIATQASPPAREPLPDVRPVRLLPEPPIRPLPQPGVPPVQRPDSPTLQRPGSPRPHRPLPQPNSKASHHAGLTQPSTGQPQQPISIPPRPLTPPPPRPPSPLGPRPQSPRPQAPHSRPPASSSSGTKNTWKAKEKWRADEAPRPYHRRADVDEYLWG